MRNDIEQFKEYSLYPSLWDKIDIAFPEMGFKKVGGYWRSSKHLDGSPSSAPDKTFIHFKMKGRIKENGGESMSLIDFEMRRSNNDFYGALKSLSNLCGLTIPNGDTEEYKEFETKMRHREEANSLFISSLWANTPESNEVLNYLRDVRHWEDSDIRNAELGYIDYNIKHTLKDSADFTDPNVGDKYRLTIPYRNGSRILGFKFRDIHCTEGQKYRNSKGLSKGIGLFGMNLTDSDIIIVEGELDALHAKAKGVHNIVATTGNAATEEQLKDAAKRGVKRFTLLFDTDEAGTKFTTSTIKAISNIGLECYVAVLPGNIKDTDEFLTSHSIEEFNTIISNAIPSYAWQYNQILLKYSSICDNQDGIITMKQREDFFSEVEKLINGVGMKPHNREVVFSLMKETEQDTLFKVEDFREWADMSYLRKQERIRKADTIEASSRIHDLLQNGEVDSALNLMKETVSKQGLKSNANKFAKVFNSPSPSELSKYLSEINEGIPTGYKFYEYGKPTEPLTLNPGLTFICGYRGHGKTSFLNNIALNDARRNLQLQNGKSVLYFSYEVDKRRILADILNTFVNDPEMSRNPINTIISYFKGNDYFRNDRINGVSHKENFEKKKDIFFKHYISSGALTIVDETYKVGELLSAIKFYISTHKVSIICIDYAQLIYSEDYSRARTEEIKKVVNDIKDFANREGIPFVMAAQFNREVESPISVDTKNIGEGGDFERIADTCIGLFNLKELHPLAKEKEERDAKLLLGKLLGHTVGNLEPIPGKLFVRLLKRRYGYYPIDIILDWEGRTKYIPQNENNDDSDLEIQQQLPF